eukprot:Clim_evm15s242 gene=Clim_evmTU15s242
MAHYPVNQGIEVNADLAALNDILDSLLPAEQASELPAWLRTTTDINATAGANTNPNLGARHQTPTRILIKRTPDNQPLRGSYMLQPTNVSSLEDDLRKLQNFVKGAEQELQQKGDNALKLTPTNKERFRTVDDVAALLDNTKKEIDRAYHELQKNKGGGSGIHRPSLQEFAPAHDLQLQIEDNAVDDLDKRMSGLQTDPTADQGRPPIPDANKSDQTLRLSRIFVSRTTPTDEVKALRRSMSDTGPKEMAAMYSGYDGLWQELGLMPGGEVPPVSSGQGGSGSTLQKRLRDTADSLRASMEANYTLAGPGHGQQAQQQQVQQQQQEADNLGVRKHIRKKSRTREEDFPDVSSFSGSPGALSPVSGASFTSMTSGTNASISFPSGGARGSLPVGHGSSGGPQVEMRPSSAGIAPRTSLRMSMSTGALPDALQDIFYMKADAPEIADDDFNVEFRGSLMSHGSRASQLGMDSRHMYHQQQGLGQNVPDSRRLVATETQKVGQGGMEMKFVMRPTMPSPGPMAGGYRGSLPAPNALPQHHPQQYGRPSQGVPPTAYPFPPGPGATATGGHGQHRGAPQQHVQQPRAMMTQESMQVNFKANVNKKGRGGGQAGGSQQSGKPLPKFGAPKTITAPKAVRDGTLEDYQGHFKFKSNIPQRRRSRDPNKWTVVGPDGKKTEKK